MFAPKPEMQFLIESKFSSVSILLSVIAHLCSTDFQVCCLSEKYKHYFLITVNLEAIQCCTKDKYIFFQQELLITSYSLASIALCFRMHPAKYQQTLSKWWCKFLFYWAWDFSINVRYSVFHSCHIWPTEQRMGFIYPFSCSILCYNYIFSTLVQ